MFLTLKPDPSALNRYNDIMSHSLPVLSDSAARRAFAMHDRVWQHNLYVYPVVSRRSKGISIGVNLNPDKICNFDCIYCSVDRTQAPAIKHVDLKILRDELTTMLHVCATGEIYRHDPFNTIPEALRRVNDIAFSGDGEPTTFQEFPDACRIAAELKQASGLNDVKIVVITNATMFHRPVVRDALSFLDQNNGEIWAKLDAGTPEYYQLIDRTAVPFQRVLDNVSWCCQTRPTVIQTLLMRVHGEPAPLTEIAAYANRLKYILEHDGRIKLIQLYTVARHTTETYATPLKIDELESIATQINGILPGIPVETYP